MAIGFLSQIVSDMENGVLNFTKDGKCTGCGKCCSNILPMSDEEVKRIKRYIKAHDIQEHRHLVPTKTITVDMTCPFLNDNKENKKCEIYPVRPMICRVFCCNQPPSEVKMNRDEFWETRDVYFLRDTFFGKEECK